MISERYLELLRKTRTAVPYWGAGGARHAPEVVRLLERAGITSGTILDYGSGVGTFANAITQLCGRRYEVTNYDPTLPQWSKLEPGPFDAVVCTHVLEHIEPELLTESLGEISARARSLAYIEVPFGPAKEVLADGRNAHINQQGLAFWLEALSKTFPDAAIAHKLNTIGTQATFWLTRRK